MKSFKKFTIQTEPHNPDVTSDILWSLDIAGITEENDSLIVYVDETSGENKQSISDLINSLVEENLIHSFEIYDEILIDKNWNEEFEKNTKVVEISDTLAIKPTFKEFTPKDGQKVILIDPKMSFGTGEHETTKLVLSLIEENIKGKEKVLDIGTGTAVLAIATILLGANSAIGVDNDEWCKLNGEENIDLNKLNDKVQIILGETKEVEENDFDFIVANINKHILLEIRDDIKSKLKDGGTVILSGLLDIDEEEIVKCYSAVGFKVETKKQMNEWIALVLK